MRYEINYAGFCIQGLVRKNNEDNIWCRDHCLEMIHIDEEKNLNGSISSDSGAAFAVFDGMGGEECGEMASYIAAKEFGTFSKQKDCDSPNCEKELCRQMNKKILDYADNNRIRNMGSTVVGIRFGKSGISGFNLGDSRCYLYSGGELKLLSTDHVVSSPFSGRTALTQCLGISEKEFILEPDSFQAGYEDGSIFILCSDGVSKTLGNEKIKKILKNKGSVNDKKIKIKDSLLKRGAPDNATALLFEVRKGGFAERLRRIFA
jgi:serine/threonine protein phosphatase PrpC